MKLYVWTALDKTGCDQDVDLPGVAVAGSVEEARELLRAWRVVEYWHTDADKEEFERNLATEPDIIRDIPAAWV